MGNINKILNLSKNGYKKNSPDVNNSFNVIPSNEITMIEDDGTPLKKGPILGIGIGNGKVIESKKMMPGKNYKFSDNVTHVIEESLQLGGQYTPKQRMGVRQNPDGSVSSHLMMSEVLPNGNWVSFPSLFQNEDGSWVDMSEKTSWYPIYLEALKRGEVYNFGKNKEAALEFGRGSWKKEYQTGGQTPTYADSLALYKNSLAQQAFYNTLKPYYKSIEVTPAIIDFNKAKVAEQETLEYEKPGLFRDWTPAEEKNFDKLKTTIRENTDPNIAYITDIVTGRLDPNAPGLRYDRRIKPQGTIYYSPGDYINKPVQKEKLLGIETKIPYYDPIAVKPGSMLTDNEVIERYNKYGSKGIPESKLRKLGLSTTTSSISTKPKGTTDPNISVDVRFRKLGLDSSFANRKKVAEQAGIENYKGTADQNKALNQWVVENYNPETKTFKTEDIDSLPIKKQIQLTNIQPLTNELTNDSEPQGLTKQVTKSFYEQLPDGTYVKRTYTDVGKTDTFEFQKGGSIPKFQIAGQKPVVKSWDKNNNGIPDRVENEKRREARVREPWEYELQKIMNEPIPRTKQPYNPNQFYDNPIDNPNNWATGMAMGYGTKEDLVNLGAGIVAGGALNRFLAPAISKIPGSSQLLSKTAQLSNKLSSGLSKGLSTPAVVGGKTIPWLTAGNLLDAYSIAMVPKIAGKTYDAFSEGDYYGGAAGLLETGFYGLGAMNPLLRTQLADDLTSLYSGSKQALNKITTQTPLRNAYKLNPLSNKQFTFSEPRIGEKIKHPFREELVPIENISKEVDYFHLKAEPTNIPYAAARGSKHWEQLNNDPRFFVRRTDKTVNAIVDTPINFGKDLQDLRKLPIPLNKLDQFRIKPEPHWLKGYPRVKTPTSPFNTRAQNDLLVEQARRSGEAPLPSYMEPYISRRYTPAAKEQEVFESFLSPEKQAELRKLRTQTFNPKNQYKQGGSIPKFQIAGQKRLTPQELIAAQRAQGRGTPQLFNFDSTPKYVGYNGPQSAVTESTSRTNNNYVPTQKEIQDAIDYSNYVGKKAENIQKRTGKSFTEAKKDVEALIQYQSQPQATISKLDTKGKDKNLVFLDNAGDAKTIGDYANTAWGVVTNPIDAVTASMSPGGFGRNFYTNQGKVEALMRDGIIDYDRVQSNPMMNVVSMLPYAVPGLGQVAAMKDLYEGASAMYRNPTAENAAWLALDYAGARAGVSPASNRLLRMQTKKALGNAYKYIPKTLKEASFVPMYRTQKPGQIQSEIDWGKWNPNIPKRTDLMKEYAEIERKAKADGTWMKDSQGNPARLPNGELATPEQWVQAQSKAWEKSYGSKGFENLDETYIGKGNIGNSDEFPPTLRESTNPLYGKSIMSNPDGNMMGYYTHNSGMSPAKDWSLKDLLDKFKITASNITDGPNYPIESPFRKIGIHQLILPKSKNTLSFDAKQAAWNTIDNPDIYDKVKALDSKIEGEFPGEKLVSTDMLARYLDHPLQKEYNRVSIKNVDDAGPGKWGEVLINKQEPGNYYKSLWGNVGDFDLSNPNIYKSLAALVALKGVGALGSTSSNEYKQGGYINNKSVIARLLK